METAKKRQILSECFRVLTKDGRLTIADFGRSNSLIQRILFNTIRSLDGFKSTDANASGLLPELIAEAGFTDVDIVHRNKTIFGEVQIFSAKKT